MFSSKFTKTGLITFAFALFSVVLFCSSLKNRAEAAPNIDRVGGFTAFTFRLVVEDVIDGLFADCSGIGSENEVIEQREVDERGNEITRKIPGRLTFQTISCRREITSNMDIWAWREQVETGSILDARKNGSIALFNQSGGEIARWNFTNGWPSEVVFAASNGIGFEEITIAHEGLMRTN